ncbi:MAG TPA: pantoate--beta-alanine ligase [Thermoanaerobaculia bacterium]|nr:pantoate--beta-alanine ligase [Thermoanaerobaculia bacterium]
MLTIRTIEETRAAVAAARARGTTIGFVPTMGFLHAGHLSLIRVVREAGAGFIVVSVFVNPRQFGPAEDFHRYPRDEERDRELIEAENVDLLFIPAVEVMYPPGATTVVSAGAVAAPLEGLRRPGHFDGVATVVVKLFNIVQPDLAALGRKDAQQCAVIDRVVRDLDIPLRLVFGETIREPDGVAMSSRNSYLTPEERALAPALHRALRAGEEAVLHGVEQVEAVERLMHGIATETEGIEIDYLALVDPATFDRPADFHRDLLLAGTIRIGRTRLIDNIAIDRKAIPHTRGKR